MKTKPVVVIALGGNALIQKGQKGTIPEQFENLRTPVQQIASLSEQYDIIITHGNGPQVGNILIQQEATDEVPKLPLEILVAQTQGQIGYMIESALDEALMKIGVEHHPLVSLITYVVVDKDDPAFQHPTKPVGPAFNAEEATKLPYPVLETPKGFRRVVPSPEPITIIEKKEIKMLIEEEFIVICCGGGGIPVFRTKTGFCGVEAVIDKDLASSLLALETGADVLVIATDVEGVMNHYNTPEQEMIASMNVKTADAFLENNTGGTGSMTPKVAAASRFIKGGGKRAVITSVESIVDAVQGNAGTQFE